MILPFSLPFALVFDFIIDVGFLLCFVPDPVTVLVFVFEHELANRILVFELAFDLACERAPDLDFAFAFDCAFAFALVLACDAALGEVEGEGVRACSNDNDDNNEADNASDDSGDDNDTDAIEDADDDGSKSVREADADTACAPAVMCLCAGVNGCSPGSSSL